MTQIKVGQTYRIIKDGCELSMGNGDTDYFGLKVGQEFTIDFVDQFGEGWCKTSNLPAGVIPFWKDFGRLCILCVGEIGQSVELVE